MSAAESPQPGHVLPTAPAVVREQPGGETMRAIVLEKFGGLDSLVYTDIPKPLPKDGEVVIKVRGFGINHAEMHMRRGEWAEAAEVSGIECVGIVDACPGGEFPVGAKVAALMGGLGRTINGSYAEYTRVRAANVALIESDLPWSQLAALPETYATAWTCLFRNLETVRGPDPRHPRRDLVLRPGGGEDGGRGRCTRHRHHPQPRAFRACWRRSAPRASSWSRRTWRADRRSQADRCGARPGRQQHHPRLAGHASPRRHAPAWPAGWAASIRSATSTRCCRWRAASTWTFFGSFVFGTPGFPLSDVPLQDIAAQVAAGRLEAAPSRVFSFDEIREAHRVMEAGRSRRENGGRCRVSAR